VTAVLFSATLTDKAAPNNSANVAGVSERVLRHTTRRA